MNTKDLMVKFGFKAIDYEPHQGGKAAVSAEEQVAMAGLTWSYSPVGFNILFVQYFNDQYATNTVSSYVLTELFERAKRVRPKPSENIQRAIANTLVCEIASPYGILCPECNGTGEIEDNNKHKRKCHICNDGRIAWNLNTRFATTFATSEIDIFAFEKLHTKLYQGMLDWLYEENTKAETLLHRQYAMEKAESKLEQAG